MDSSDEWLDFRKKFSEMGEEPSDDIIELLEIMCGSKTEPHIQHIEEPKTQLDYFLDEIENKLSCVQEVQNKIKKRIYEKKHNNILRLQK